MADEKNTVTAAAETPAKEATKTTETSQDTAAITENTVTAPAKTKTAASAEATAKKASTTTKTAASSLESIGKKILAAHPKQAEVFVISNGRAFFNQADAANAARGLGNKTVTTVKR